MKRRHLFDTSFLISMSSAISSMGNLPELSESKNTIKALADDVMHGRLESALVVMEHFRSKFWESFYTSSVYGASPTCTAYGTLLLICESLNCVFTSTLMNRHGHEKLNSPQTDNTDYSE